MLHSPFSCKCVFIPDLEANEPWGAKLHPSPDPYGLSQRVEDLNRELRRSPKGDHRKVTIREDLNEYYSYEESLALLSKSRDCEIKHLVL